MQVTVVGKRGEDNVNIVYWLPKFLVSMVAHFVCALFTGFVVYTAQPGTSLFSWHPTLMVIAFAFLMAEAILVFSPESSLLRRAVHSTKLNTHVIGMLLSLLCASVGVFVIWYNKEQNGKAHMTSWHGILGYITAAYVCIQCVAGIFVKYHSILSAYLKPVQLKMYHATSGLMLYGLACGSLVLGMYSNWFTGLVTGTSWWACLACPALLVVVVMNQITQRYLEPKQIR